MTTIDQIGEDELIALFAPLLPTTDAEVLGPGDDAAVVSIDGHLVVSSDVVVQDVHFRTEWSTGADVGWRAAVQNIADIDAMGAVPTALQVTLAAPGDTPVEWVVDLARGLAEACAPHGVGVVGGDLSRSAVLMVSVTAMGETHGTDPITRAEAHPGDVVAVSGPLGAARAGYEQLAAGRQIDAATVALFKRPRPRIGAGLEAALHGASAMMDISDGLIKDAGRLARASEVSVALDSASVPVHPGVIRAAAELGADALLWALTGGEDHHMLASFPRAESVPESWTIVGEVVPGEGVTVDGERPDATGWDHFQA